MAEKRKQRAKPKKAGKSSKKPQGSKPSVDAEHIPVNSQVLITLDQIKTAYIKSEGLLSVAAQLCNINIRRYKVYLYRHYKDEMAEVIEDVIEQRADKIMKLSNRMLHMIQLKTDLAIEIMEVPKDQRTPELFDYLKVLSIREQQFFIFLLQIYAKHRGFSLVYNSSDFTVETTGEHLLEPEERQVLSDGFKEVAKYNPEIFTQLKVIQGGKK